MKGLPFAIFMQRQQEFHCEETKNTAKKRDEQKFGTGVDNPVSPSPFANAQ